MQLDQSFNVAGTLGAVWRAFDDLHATALCIPGAEIENVEDNRTVHGVFKVQLGPIKAAFAGDAEVVRDEATHSGTITGAGRDGKNSTRVKAVVEYKLVPLSADVTSINLSVDYSITGPLAQFSRASIVKEIAGGITKIFAANLERMLTRNVQAVDVSRQNAGGQPAVPVVSELPPQQQSVAPGQSLNLLSLVWSLVWGKIKGMFSAQKAG